MSFRRKSVVSPSATGDHFRSTMPRRETPDDGEEAPQSRHASFTSDSYLQDAAADPALQELEDRLQDDVDEDFFQEPRKFNTLDRVIEVLGLQMASESEVSLDRNPAYQNLREQRQVVEGAIEHMAVIHCADLNGSVIQVGRVARQFSDAVTKVRQLRNQVRDIQDTLGTAAATTANNNKNKKRETNVLGRPRATPTAGMSLRELWLKKLESEATLHLLDRLDIIRVAPSKFDYLVRQTPCRIGAAVVVLSEALEVMFADNVAQVQALHKIMEQLLMRKQRAEEILWETLQNVIFLRTANGRLPRKLRTLTGRHASSGQSVQSGRSGATGNASRVSFMGTATAASGADMTTSASLSAFYNPFVSAFMRYALEEDAEGDNEGRSNDLRRGGNDSDDEDDEDADDRSHASLFSVEDADDGGSVAGGVSVVSAAGPQKVLIPIPILESELDLEDDERRCLEDYALNHWTSRGSGASSSNMPRYGDPVLSLRILVECLARLQRLDDVERILLETLEIELQKIRQREQARTFARLEYLQQATGGISEFRRHLACLLSAYGNVMVRLSHLAEIVRFRISADRELKKKMQAPSSFLRSVLSSAYLSMQREIKEFMMACLTRSDTGGLAPLSRRSTGYESGLFSLGIVQSDKPKKENKPDATRNNVMELASGKFVAHVLLAKTKVEASRNHALVFRRSVARWTQENENLQKELASLTGEDTSAPSFKAMPDQLAITHLDKVIQDELLPAMQKEAVDGTVQGLERRDAFDPILDRGLYARPNSNEPQDVDMCVACQVLHDRTSSLFMALHRLPRGGEMYLPLVAVLEHVVLTFISRIKKQVARLCDRKTAQHLLQADGVDGIALSTIMEHRRPFALLNRAYSGGEIAGANESSSTGHAKTGIKPLAAPSSDTTPRQTISDLEADAPVEDLAEDVDGEERVLEQELAFIRPYLQFEDSSAPKIVVCSDEEIMKCATLAHSLLKVSSLLEARLEVRGSAGYAKSLSPTRALREAIKTVKVHGIKMAKFCRLDMLMQSIQRLSKVASSSTLVAHDAVRIPSSVNDLGEYLTGASENLKEACGTAVTGYALSSLEQYVPLGLMQTVRTMAKGKGIVTRAVLTMNGIEALDRSGSVLYRDLKGATSFDNSFWDVELAAISFERSASFMAMMELEIEELSAFYTANRNDFSDEDFSLMFGMTGPRRRGDVGRFHMLKKKLQK